MSDHYHYEYAEARHDHRGEYADERHDHDLDYAEKYHRHYDEESRVAGLREDLGRAEERIRELGDDLRDALERIRALEDRQPDYSDTRAWPDDWSAARDPEAGEDQDHQPAAVVACGCPKADGMIRHQRATCTDPVVARLDWYAGGEQ